MKLLILFFVCFACSLALPVSEPLSPVVPHSHHLPRDEHVFVPIVSGESKLNPNGDFRYFYESGDGTKVEEQGTIVMLDKDHFGPSVHGAYEYQSPEGRKVRTTYTADENGYRPVITYDGEPDTSFGTHAFTGRVGTSKTLDYPVQQLHEPLSGINEYQSRFDSSRRINEAIPQSRDQFTKDYHKRFDFERSQSPYGAPQSRSYNPTNFEDKYYNPTNVNDRYINDPRSFVPSNIYESDVSQPSEV